MPGVRRVDETPAADVDADVAEPVEEDEVARSQRPARDPAAEVELRDRVVRQRDPEVREDEAGEARAVEAAARRGAAVAVTDAEQMAGVGDDASLARGRVLGACGGAECSAGAGGDEGDEHEYEQRKANAIRHKRLPSGAARTGRRRRDDRWQATCQQRLLPTATPRCGGRSSLERGRPVRERSAGPSGPRTPSGARLRCTRALRSARARCHERLPLTARCAASSPSASSVSTASAAEATSRSASSCGSKSAST